MLAKSISGRVPGVSNTFTWAGKPSAALNPWREIWITDVGIRPVKFYSNGVRYLPVDRELVLGRGKTDITTSTVNTSENWVAGCSVPIALCAPGAKIEVERLYDMSAGTGSKIERVRYGTTTGTLGAAFAAGTLIGNASLATSVPSSDQNKSILHFADSGADAQFCVGTASTALSPYVNPTNAAVAGAVANSTALSYINLTLTKGVATDTVKLKEWEAVIKF